MDQFVAPIAIGGIHQLEETGETWVVLRWPRRDGRSEQMRIPFGEFNAPRKLLTTLMNRGCVISIDYQDWCDVLDKIKTIVFKCLKNNLNVTAVTRRVGWSDDFSYFVLPSKTIGDGPMFMSNNLENFIEEKCSGSYEGWISEVANPARHSSRFVLIIAAAFAAPLLKLMGWPSFGINLSGPSSIGKSTGLRAGWSIVGGGELRPHGTTKRALEELAKGHRDLPLALDETAILRSGDRALNLSQLTYQLFSGKSDAISRNSRAEIGERGEEWKLSVMSTSEGRLFDGNRKEGEYVRLIDVPPPANSHTGLIDSLVHFKLGKRPPPSALDIINQINKGVEHHHGHALPLFIHRIMKDQQGARRLCDKYSQEFKARHSGDFTLLQGRLLNIFANCYAAGHLASDLGIVEWNEDILESAISRCWIDTVNAIPNAARDVQGLAHKIIEFALHQGDFLIREGAPRLSDFTNHDGVRIDHGEAKSASILISHKHLHAKFPGEPQLNGALSLLKEKGILRGEKGRKVYTDLITFEGGSKKRFYHVDVAKAEAFHDPRQKQILR
jgi:hypothetical protein